MTGRLLIDNSIMSGAISRNTIIDLQKCHPLISLSLRMVYRTILASICSTSRARTAAFPLRRTFCHPQDRPWWIVSWS